MKLHKIAKFALIAGSVAAMAMPVASHAVSFEDVGSTLTLGTADLKETIINILNLLLGLLALIAVIMVILGGFMWLTSGGNEEKVDKAKKTISSAVIGMVIVLLAWALIIYVANTTKNVSGA